MPSMNRSKPRREVLDWNAARERLARASDDRSRIDPERRERILEERARALARKPEALTTTHARPNSVEVELVQFRWAREQYAIDAQFVHEVIEPSEVTRLPGAPAHLRGITNLRGEIVPVFDLRAWFEIDRSRHSDDTRWLVLGANEPEMCLIADGVDDLVTLDPRTLHRLDSDVRRGCELVQGVTSDARTVLDGAALLAHPELSIGEEPANQLEVIS
jgi:purine-binding chemotaxis protein CheW